MKHGYYGRKLGRNIDERRRLFMILTRSLLQTGRVRTTLAKAKAIQPMVEKLITKAKSGSSSSLRVVSQTLSDIEAYTTLLDMAKTRFGKRTSGYTRIVKLDIRRGDASNMVYLEFVDAAPKKEEPKAVKPTKAAKGKDVVQEAEVVTEEKVEKPGKKTKTATTKKTK